MNKSIYLIACLLSAKNVLAMDTTIQSEKKVPTLSKSVGGLYEEGGEGAVKIALRNLQIRQTSETLNKVTEDETALGIAYSEEKKELFLFLLRNGADPSLSSGDEDSVLEQVENNNEFMALVKSGCMIKLLEEFVIKANYATKEELPTIISDLKALVEVKEEENIEMTKKEKMDSVIGELRKTDAVKSAEGSVGEEEKVLVEDPEEKIAEEEKLSEGDVEETLELLRDEKIVEAQKIENLRAGFKGTKAQDFLGKKYGIEYIAGALVAGVVGTCLLFKIIADDNVSN